MLDQALSPWRRAEIYAWSGAPHGFLHPWPEKQNTRLNETINCTSNRSDCESNNFPIENKFNPKNIYANLLRSICTRCQISLQDMNKYCT